MTECKHSKIVLLPEKNKRLRCCHCHLTIEPEELGDSYCPECFEVNGKKRYEFEEIEDTKTGITRYRCEDCGVIIECGQPKNSNKNKEC